MDRLKEILTSWRVLLLIVVLLMSIWAIHPQLSPEGVLVESVSINSSAEINGIIPGEIIYAVNEQVVNAPLEYGATLTNSELGDLVKLRTSIGEQAFVFSEEPQLTVGEVPTSNLRKGLDLVGGVRVILQPNEGVTAEQMDDLVTLITKRLNVYGISDIVVRPTEDFENNKYIVVEIAGSSEESVARLLSQQGKFEAKIKNQTIFLGGQDIKYVCRSADCSGINLQSGCGQTQEGNWVCSFQFRVDVSPESAKLHAAATRNLEVVYNSANDAYLSEPLELYLDDELVNSLQISASLQGIESTSFVIQGPGEGTTRDAAINDALKSMKDFQTLLITGSLPVKLEIVKVDVVSPTLGEEFFGTALKALIAALLAVGAVTFIRYRKLKIAVPILFTGLSEILIILGFAALIRWNLDLAAIAGILAAIGTGVDDQIVITDEVLRGERAYTDWNRRIKQAFFIIMAAYFTTVVAMMPLWAIGAGMLRGFALTTIVGVSVGVFITRPAFAKIIEVLLK